MHSTDFYETYNRNIRNQEWKPYKVFSALLHNAVKKISHNCPLPKETTLYRGLNKRLSINTNDRFYFSQFVPTTLSNEDATKTGFETTLVFTLPRLAANMDGLTKEGEQVVLLSPFEAFEVVGRTDDTVYLKSSDTQDFNSDEFDLQAFVHNFEALSNRVDEVDELCPSTPVPIYKLFDEEYGDDDDKDDDKVDDDDDYDYDFDSPWC